jgi:putative transcriptional regulator
MSNRLKMPQKSTPLQGYLLVAAPHMQDDLFAQSVCMVVHHGKQGAIGVFLNKELDAHAPGLWEQLAGKETQYSKALLHLGGPNSGPVIAVHGHEPLAEYTSACGVYFAAQVDHLRKLLSLATNGSGKGERSAVKIIVGQANWGPGQLDAEFAAGKWLPLPVTSKVVFAERQTMWQQAIKEIGNQFVASLVGCRKVPPSELLN